MIDMQPQFVSTTDFFNYWQVDLIAKLNKGANTSNFANVFLRRVEDRLMSWIDANTFRVVPWDIFKDSYNCGIERKQKRLEEQKVYWKKAILEQAMYVFRNSDIGMDSGYDPEKGIIAPFEELENIEICKPAIRFIKETCLYNHVMKNRPRYTSF